MRRYLLLAAWALPLAGCIFGSGGRTGPGKVPKDVISAGYTMRPAGDVAQCIGAAVQAAPTSNGTAYVIGLPDLSYSVETTTQAGIYPTQVFVRGHNLNKDQVRNVALCMAGVPND